MEKRTVTLTPPHQDLMARVNRIQNGPLMAKIRRLQHERGSMKNKPKMSNIKPK